jgi:hypothetical protein
MCINNRSSKKIYWWSPKNQTREFNFDLIDHLNLDNNLDSEEWKRPENEKILNALRANNYKVELNKSFKYWGSE